MIASDTDECKAFKKQLYDYWTLKNMTNIKIP